MDNHSWWTNAVIYEAYVDKFAGTFAQFSERLDYLEALGINCIHVLPHYPSPMADIGYDVSDYRAVRSELGTLVDFSRFTKQARQRGIRVIVDLVLNHTSDEHPWFLEARSSRTSPRRNFYIWSNDGKNLLEAINPFGHIKHGTWIANPATEDYFYSSFYPEQADLNWDNPNVLTEFLGIMDFWVAHGASGFRLDAVAYLIKREGTRSRGLPETHAVIKKLRAHVEAHYPEVVLLGEVSAPLDALKTFFGAGDECHLLYHFPMAKLMMVALTTGDRATLEAQIAASGGIPENCAWAFFLRNHDELSLATLPEKERARLFALLDSYGKYRFGSGIALRLASIFGGDEKKLRQALALLFSLRGTVVLYYGDEIGMKNDERRKPVPDAREYVRGVFDLAEARRAMADAHSLWAYVSRLIHAKI
ncbi:MAG: alpha-amylase family glycosyl hydrolase [bacterium]|nr:alpha-amylase family glycosyl hydrolase [bacterium]